MSITEGAFGISIKVFGHAGFGARTFYHSKRAIEALTQSRKDAKTQGIQKRNLLFLSLAALRLCVKSFRAYVAPNPSNEVSFPVTGLRSLRAG